MIKNVLKLFFCFVILGIPLKSYTQKAYKVTYYISKPKIHGSTDNLSLKDKQLLKQVLDYAKEVNYILTVNQDESYFKEEDALKKEINSPLERMLSRSAQRFTSFNEEVYANYKKDTIFFVKNLVDQDFMVKRVLFDFNWVIKNESKKILGFDTKKAEGNYYDPVINKELKVEAWFIPSIPLHSGPDIYMGLPGLIAEVNLKRAVVSIKKIESNLNLEIKKVDDLKAITQQEYEDLIKELTIKFKNYIEN